MDLVSTTCDKLPLPCNLPDSGSAHGWPNGQVLGLIKNAWSLQIKVLDPITSIVSKKYVMDKYDSRLEFLRSIPPGYIVIGSAYYEYVAYLTDEEAVELVGLAIFFIFYQA